ncbi:MAG: type II toxin-antitoxin system VapC family toxin [Deltaproteobacteria bacterium]|nr:MAG: type II toxin-antitoxin system VapC family toxin [Deltaproteobacteria bacterium]
MYILDTDHISLFQRDNPGVVSNVLKKPQSMLATTVITAEEQLRGRLAMIRKARTDERIVNAYDNLLATVLYFRTITVIGFGSESQTIFRKLREGKIRIGTQDLRIAAIAIARDATVVTRNQKDFSLVPSLKTEDWSSA